MALVTLSTKPTRHELRDARRMLLPLAACQMQEAVEELRALDALIKRLYPRRTADDASEGRPQQQARRRGKQRRTIEAGDCLGTCPGCRGKRAWTNAVCSIFCTVCAGAGEIPIGASEHAKGSSPEEWTLIRGTRNRDKALRGDWAVQAGGSTVRNDGTAARHGRGYNGLRLVGPPSEVEQLEREEWRVDRYDTPWCDAADISSVLEGDARRAAKDPDFGLDWLLGRRLVKRSERERGILTDGQQRRAKMERRVRRYQAEFDRAKQKTEGRSYLRRDMCEATMEMLKAMGVDVAAVPTSGAPANDSPVIAEARRRGDLPPDDLLVARADPLMVRVLAGPHTGKHGRYTVSLIAAAVVRSSGRVEHRQHAARVEFDNGEFDVVHADDVFPVAELVGGAA